MIRLAHWPADGQAAKSLSAPKMTFLQLIVTHRLLNIHGSLTHVLAFVTVRLILEVHVLHHVSHFLCFLQSVYFTQTAKVIANVDIQK